MRTSLVIVGPGRLGRSASCLLAAAGTTHELIGRHELIPAAEVTWLTVPDREVSQAAQSVPAGGIVLHASGALDVGVLRPHSSAGSLHPLMSFPGPEHGLPEGLIPAAVAGDCDAQAAASELAHALGFTPFEVCGDRRLYHAAAVLAGNFTTTLLLEASRTLARCGLSESEARRLLAPLAQTSLKHAVVYGKEGLTGPVARGDEAVITAHQSVLDELDPGLSELYRTMTAATRRVKRRP